MNNISKQKTDKNEIQDNKDKIIEKLEKELKFAKSQMSRALSLYDDARQQAEKANKAKSEFLSKLSHEFRTPMNALVGYSDILNNMDHDSETRYCVAGIKNATHTLLNLVNNLIEVTRIESGVIESNKDEYSTKVLVESIVGALKDYVIEKGLILNLNIGENIPSRLIGDFYHLRQIVCNILDNAVKFTEKGYIGLDIQANKGEATNEAGRKSVQLCFRIKDTGCGIEKKDQDRLFKSFSQFNNKNPYANSGVGIGLMVAKYFSNNMHGDITFESNPGEGSTFVCTVIQEIVDESPMDIMIDAGKNVYRQIKFKAPDASVLVVDDSMVNLNVASGILKSYDINADIAEGGYAALKLIKSKKYDLIFMDHMMPDIDGVETTKIIREKGDWCEHVPIIALTANTTDEARNLFKMNGMQDFLAKPIELALLRDILIKWLPKDSILFEDVCDGHKSEYKNIIDNIENSDKKDTVFSVERLAKEGIDLNKGLTYFGGNIEAYKSTISDIFKDCSKKHMWISNYLKDKNLEKYAIEAHSVKSVAASIGAINFSESAKEMEFRAKAGDVEFIEAKGPKFVKAYGDFVAGLGRLLEEENELKGISKNSDTDDKSDKSQCNDEDIRKVINHALALLCDYETDDAICELKNLSEMGCRVDIVEKVYTAMEKIDDFEYEEAKDILKEILQMC